MKKIVIHIPCIALLCASMLCVPILSGAQNKDAKEGTEQLDLIDVVHAIGHGGIHPRSVDSMNANKTQISVVPAAGYSLQTGFAVLLAGNAAFTTDSGSLQSSISTSLTYSQYKQIIFPVLSQIYFHQNKYILTTDWRYLKYPSLTFGLGNHTQLDEGYTLDYSALRLHQSILRKVTNNVYLGLGWDFDYFWNIREVDTPEAQTITDFQRYGSKKTETANGPVVTFQWDTRKNVINPLGGGLFKIESHLHPQFLGNEQSWRSTIVDIRKYVRFPASTQNILAFWSYDWFTKQGKVPYLLLPNTGGDPASNTGRGYIQGRFRGANFLYLESEYRFRILSNGLLGGVVFGNAESVPRDLSKGISVISPGYGAGIRLKLNKISGANISVDYAWGAGGSKGVFVNLGEVF